MVKLLVHLHKENEQNICNIRETIYPASGGLAENLLKKVEKAGCGCNDMSIHDDDLFAMA